ncbi:hypothetical protein Vretimale_18244 [Volvox reticuliferus]|uniref:Uncharacterized protein n=1 Tax=Volvox reticuliferus TaxID=1737510 RepID=A0A8J4CYU2_9CHLO|nr:hypothetical protein Vretifemale_18014 [Volvox reticuliferus]GIM15465.1 hypothetical protein Vretimale_18244 [Volvox reticuliferus]
MEEYHPKIRLRRPTSSSLPIVILGIVVLVALFGVTIAGATRQGHNNKRSLNAGLDQQPTLHRQRCESEQDVEIGSEDDPDDGHLSPQALANNNHPTQQVPPPPTSPPTTSPPIATPTLDASNFQAMMTAMLTSPMFLQQMAMALQQVPQAQTTFVPATEQPEASAVQQAGPSSPP